ncbi:hypothetical protein ABMA28_004945 [Loxostege sticticalis]|uniref:Tyr recombinase domain-containing protein n=1 Tax=Loxostege sticticalis TaxID=481309 RepID=A0ABD0SNQ7_LOXSC
MPKRRHENAIEYLASKLKKLEKKMKRSRKRRSLSESSSSTSSSSESSSASSRNPSPAPPTMLALSDQDHHNATATMEPDHTAPLLVPEPVAGTSASETIRTSQEPETTNFPQENTGMEQSSGNLDTGLDPDILDILGTDPSAVMEYGPNINEELASRLNYLATSGLDKDSRKELMQKYLVPINCKNISAPQLNPEIKAATPEYVQKRDKSIEFHQKEIAAAIACIGQIMTTQINNSTRDNELLKSLMDVKTQTRQEFKPQVGPRESSGGAGPSTSTAADSSSSDDELPATAAAAAAVEHARPLLDHREHPPQPYPGGRDLIRAGFLRRDVPLAAIDIMLASLSENTMKQYDSCFKKWFTFCNDYKIDMYTPTVPNIIQFLTNVLNSGNQYQTINCHRAAVSLLVGPLDDDLITRFCKGVYKLRPPLPRYNMTWDANTVLDYLSSLYPNDEITLDKISKKCVTLLALVTGHRVQTLSKIKIDNLVILHKQIVIKIPDLIKTSRPGSNQPTLHLPYFENRVSICPAHTLNSYINKTKEIRKSNNLFISFRSPHKPVCSQTLSRWIKSTLQDSGIDVSIFSAHSTRHAATSLAHRDGVNIDLIRKTAGWSGNSTVFAQFYNRPVVSNEDYTLFARTLSSSR